MPYPSGVLLSAAWASIVHNSNANCLDLKHPPIVFRKSSSVLLKSSISRSKVYRKYKSCPRDPILGQKVWPMEGKMEHYLFINRSLSWDIWEIKENTAWQIIHTVAIYKNWTYHCVNIQREGVIYSNIILSIDFWPWKRWFWKGRRTESQGRPSEDVSSPSSQGCPTFLPGRIDFMKSPFENVEGRFSLQNLPLEGRKDILPLKSPLENSKGDSLFKISFWKRENIFSGEF